MADRVIAHVTTNDFGADLMFLQRLCHRKRDVSASTSNVENSEWTIGGFGSQRANGLRQNPALKLTRFARARPSNA